MKGNAMNCELCGNEINDGSWRERAIDEHEVSYACVECVKIHDATAEEEWGDK
ncbi:hypothetical protein UFOVP1246_33 [uncultured Caudovirales phage]|uniref:Uncharacterized protein n=1 Tax=uncultured Caudovirales phage TaxID=2100421 RepID=A0A6J5R7V9_9CAUD|nr:hypothetical protein UFOVP1246_33 [uncultured Caudovirales phage]